MGERPDQIERHIQRQRDELGDNFSELEDKVKSAFDWRSQFEEHPGMLLGAAFVGGAVIAAILPSRSTISSGVSSGRKYVSDRWDSYTSPHEDSPSTYSAPSPVSHAAPGHPPYSNQPAGQSSDVWQNLRNAAIGLATARLSEYIEDLVPGFAEHYKKAASGKPTNFGNVPTPQEQHQQHNWQKPNGGTDYASHS
jgi:hypothetical protein